MNVRLQRRLSGAVIVAALITGACGGSDESSSDSAGTDAPPGVEVPDGATLCGTYADEYKVILDGPTVFGEDGWDAEAQELVRLATILQQLAPADQAANAAANVGYFQALADVESAGEFVDGSNAFNFFLIEDCLT